jgi:methyl-accepting chemotaxis protein
VGTKGATPTGRFAPYYYWDNGKVELDVLEDFNDSGVDYYQLPKRNNAPTILDPFTYNVGGKTIMMTTVAVPIHNNGRLVGVVGIDIGLDEFQKIASRIKPFDGAVTAIFSNNGTVAAHFIPGNIGQDMRQSEQAMAGTHMNDFVNAIKNGTSLSFTNYVAPLGVDLTVYATPITIGETTTPWSFGLGVPQNVVMKPVYDMMTLTFVLGGIILIVVILAAIFFSRSITKPIVTVAETLKDIAQGEGDLTRTIAANSKDEIGSLALYFNETLAKIKNLIITIKKETVTLSDIGGDLASNMNETAAAVNEITANIQSIKGRVINQSAGVSETHATMENLVGNIKKLDEIGRASCRERV